MTIVAILLSSIFILLALILSENNAQYLLSGYNTLSEAERKNFDLEGYLPFFKKFHIFLGISLMVLYLIINNAISEEASGMFIVFYPLTLYIFFLSRNLKYYTPGKGKRITKFVIGVVVFVLGGISVLFYISFKESNLSLNMHTLEINGLYGEEIELKAIKEIGIKENIPQISYKSNGFALGKVSKGYFKTKDEGTVKLILNTNKGPFLYINTIDDKVIYYSSNSQNLLSILTQIESKLNTTAF